MELEFFRAFRWCGVFFLLLGWLTLKVIVWGEWMDQDLNYELTGTHQAKSGTRQEKKSTWNLFRGGKFKKTLDVLVVSVFFWGDCLFHLFCGCDGATRNYQEAEMAHHAYTIHSLLILWCICRTNLPSTNYYSSIASLKLFQLGNHAFAIGSCLYYI